MTRLASPTTIRPSLGSKLLKVFNDFKQNSDLYDFFVKNIAASYGRDEIIAHMLMGLLLIGSLGLFFLNASVFKFTSTVSSLNMLLAIPAWWIWWLIGHTHRTKRPRLGLLAATFANIGICCIIFMINWSAILSTPFSIIDYHLLQWDHFLGFDVVRFMNWAYQFPSLIKVLLFAYNSWEFQIILTPIVLALLNKSREINRYFIAAAVCLMFCNLIYYFFPTIAPAGIMSSPHFWEPAYHLVTRFYEVHQRLPITDYDGGMVSFPSGHVMYALLVLFTFRNVKFLFYPLLVLNSLLIMATMALGLHYLVDVIASFIIVTVVLSGMHFLLDRKKSR